MTAPRPKKRGFSGIQMKQTMEWLEYAFIGLLKTVWVALEIVGLIIAFAFVMALIVLTFSGAALIVAETLKLLGMV